VIYVLALEYEWDSARLLGAYDAATLDGADPDAGSLQAYRADQWEAARRREYGDVFRAMVLLVVDPDRVGVPVREETDPATGESSPRIHGPLPLDAVVEVRPLRRTSLARALVNDLPSVGRQRGGLMTVLVVALVVLGCTVAGAFVGAALGNGLAVVMGAALALLVAGAAALRLLAPLARRRRR
jgi:uncharacterized protein (DUF952 family)